MIRAFLLASILVGVLFRTEHAIAQRAIPVTHFLDLLEKGRYDQLLGEALAMRDITHGRNYVVDWFIAKAIDCSDHHDQAMRWYRSIEKRYVLTKEFKDFLSKEIVACAARSTTCPPIFDRPATLDHSRGRAQWVPEMPKMASVHDKMGRMYRCDTRIPEHDFTEQQAEQRRVLPVAMRGFEGSLDTLRASIPIGYVLDTAGAFVLVSRAGHLDGKGVASTLDRMRTAHDFFLRAYGFQPAPFYIVAGLFKTSKDLIQAGRELDGLQVPGHVLGYSSPSDMTMFGIAAPMAVGTMYHELFHVLVRADLGDIPAWLDEGTASVYESVLIVDGTLSGLYHYNGNFRLEMLQKASAFRDELVVPPLADLVSMTWDDFDGLPGQNGCMPAIHYALAKHFCLWLQDTGLLTTMVGAHRHSIRLADDGVPVPISSRELVEQVLEVPMEIIQTRFNAWFKQRYGFPLYPLNHR